MVAITGTYHKGEIKLDNEYQSENPVKVIVTFLDDEKAKDASPEKRLTIHDFSFLQSRKLLEHYKGSFGDEVIAERRSEL